MRLDSNQLEGLVAEDGMRGFKVEHAELRAPRPVVLRQLRSKQ